MAKLFRIMRIRQFVLLFSVLGILISCGSTNTNKNKTVINRKIVDPEGEPMLIGLVRQDALTAPEFDDWYSNEYNAYIPDYKVLKRLKSRARLYQIEVFFGTWSTDSKEQVPRFLKVLNELKYPEKMLSLYAVNRKKQSFYGEEAQKALFKVPTFIVYKGKTEIGRITEAPSESIELDLYKIITGKKFGQEDNKAKKSKKSKKRK